MAFIRAKRRDNGRTYYALVENRRVGGKVRQRVILHLPTPHRDTAGDSKPFRTWEDAEGQEREQGFDFRPDEFGGGIQNIVDWYERDLDEVAFSFRLAQADAKGRKASTHEKAKVRFLAREVLKYEHVLEVLRQYV